jgi:hypothetical protein
VQVSYALGIAKMPGRFEALDGQKSLRSFYDPLKLGLVLRLDASGRAREQVAEQTKAFLEQVELSADV